MKVTKNMETNRIEENLEENDLKNPDTKSNEVVKVYLTAELKEWVKSESERQGIKNSKFILELISKFRNGCKAQSAEQVTSRLEELESKFQDECSQIRGQNHHSMVELSLNFATEISKLEAQLRESLACQRELLLYAKANFLVDSAQIFTIVNEIESSAQSEERSKKLEDFAKARGEKMDEKIRAMEESLGG